MIEKNKTKTKQQKLENTTMLKSYTKTLRNN